MCRRHLESVSAALYGRCFASFVSSRSLSVRGSWGTAPSAFWYGAPGGTQGPLGKGGVAKRWRVAYPIGIATRHGAQPATTRTHKRNAPAASRTSRHPPVTPPRCQATTNLAQKPFATFHRKAVPRRPGIPFMPRQRLPQPLGQGSPFLSLIYTVRALHRWCAGYGAPGGCPARPDTPRTAPLPRGSRGSCAGSWPHPRYTGPPRVGNADR